MKNYSKLYIDGAWVEPLAPSAIEVINPATEMPIARVALGGAADVDRAVKAARRALLSFSRTSKADRIALLEAISASYAKRVGDVAAAITAEMGSPRSVEMQAGAALSYFRQAIATLKDYDFETKLGDNIVRREPIGVCGLITAWNWPMTLIVTKLSSALAAGCTVVLKPSEFAPLSAIVLAEALHDAGVPQGVFNLVNGDGPTVGHAISSHPGIDLVSFTGSTRAGILIAQAGANSVKRVTQELGGKSPNIVLPDADLDAAVRWGISRGFTNAGQSCQAPTRLLVHRSQADDALRIAQAEASKVKVGDPQDPATTMGPVASRAQFQRVQNYIEKGIAEGGRLAFGGLGRPEGLDRGFFVKPTLFADVTKAMTIAREEIFGPVLSIMPYSSEDEAIEIANATPYGLAAYIFTGDREKARRVASEVQAGRVFFNGAPANAVAPMGGYKQSGNGRELGIFGLEEYLEVKALIGFEP